MKLLEIQQALRDQELDGWLFFDHHRRDPLAYRILSVKPGQEVTRRWYYLIPANGEPKALVHQIEQSILGDLPGTKTAYSSWVAQVDGLRNLLAGCRRVAMQYSPNCSIPYVSMVDAGTVELIRSLGVEVAGSADLVQRFEARWNEEKLSSHLEASKRVDSVRREAFQMVGKKLRAGESVDELKVKQFILDSFARSGLLTDDGPIVAVGANSADPHYEPSEQRTRKIQRGDVLLIDMWAKLKDADSVFYDITWMAFCGPEAPPHVEKIFNIVREARDQAVQRVQKAIEAGETLRGFEVDDVARNHIRQAGYGEYFVHRTGHSIGEEVHGAGANMDNLETHDERQIIPWTCFSIEPGIYLKDFGVRSELNVFVDERRARVTGEIQQRIVLI
jgi:Xaa-Pro dipeptidase